VIKVIDVVPSATYQEDAKDHKLICLNGWTLQDSHQV
jgi:hypothetical protein